MSDVRFSDEQLELVARVIKWIQTQRHLPNREPFDDAERAALARHRASALEALQAEASLIGWTAERAPHMSVKPPPPYKQWFPSHSETEGSPVSEYPDIAEPPCRFCRLFAARREYLDNGAPAPMRLCWSEAMLPDFSCYRPREAK